jgi:hypothetical protein
VKNLGNFGVGISMQMAIIRQNLLRGIQRLLLPLQESVRQFLSAKNVVADCYMFDLSKDATIRSSQPTDLLNGSIKIIDTT